MSDDSRPISPRLIFIVGTLFGILAAVASYAFTLITGRSMWTLQADPSAVWPYVLAMNLIYYYTWGILTPPVLWLARRFRFGREPWRMTLPAHILGGALFMSLHVLAIAASRYSLQTAFGMHVSWWPIVADAFFRTTDWELAVYCAIVGVSHALDYHVEAKERALRASQLEARLAEAQLQALQRQLHPHFLFNTLNAISELMHKDVEAADLMISQLGDLLRLATENVGVQVVALKTELDFLQKYLEIEQTRFRDRLTVRLEIDPEALDAAVPSLILQPLVENAIRHGIGPRRGGGTITVRGTRENGNLVLEVRDNGGGLSGQGLRSLRTGVGLSNTRARLRHLYGDRHGLEFTSDAGLAVRLVIPFTAIDAGGQKAQEVA